MEETIAAISTPAGTGAIAMIRLSGPKAWEIAGLIFSGSAIDKGAESFCANQVHHGRIYDDERTVDEVMTVAYQSPKSYTGEDMIEITCHGSVYIQQEILNLLIRKGARMAQPGEFTQRAYLNGKLDLSQAEAVADLIAASGQASHRLAIDQLRGGISNELDKIRGELLHFVTLIELELDFSEEDVEFVDRSRLKVLLDSILVHFDKLIRSFELGNAIKSGVPVAIVGETNVGKSTLLNVLLKDDKAIVSEIAGTTRDVIEDTIHIGGIEFRFIDTAGIRETHDAIETLGIERAYGQIEKARIILLMADATAPEDQSLQWIEKIGSHIREDQHLIILLNKTDLVSDIVSSKTDFLKSSIVHRKSSILPISAKTGTGLEHLVEVLLELVNIKALEDNDVVITNARHYEALVNARTALYRTLNGLHSGTSGDFLAQDIREAMHHLESITGAISSDEILGNIFRNFCIGK
ncbi:MAG: tRNA uridine-5-carboxymethylaminomethyl(34) synthesis GTPase MnmE [Bacteroidota bacterium]